jgi:tRNA dimethylallyltransferase
MDIGTAKPTEDEQARVPHHMIDIITPDEPFDASNYAATARKKIERLHWRKVLPVVTGGTGLYIKALLHGLFPMSRHAPDIRRRLKSEAARFGTPLLHERLGRCDPEAAERIHPNDGYRILRALEVYEITGKSISDAHSRHRFADEPYRVLSFGLDTQRQELYDRIDRRVDTMIDLGFVGEVEGLLARGYSADLKSMQSLGYRHVVGFLKGAIPWDETVRTMKRDTRRYAKRQLTWFRSDPETKWMEPDRLNEMKELADLFLKGSQLDGRFKQKYHP